MTRLQLKVKFKSKSRLAAIFFILHPLLPLQISNILISHFAGQEIHRLLWKPKGHYHVQKSSSLGPILSQMYPVYSAAGA
jgi:hypothetical protein